MPTGACPTRQTMKALLDGTIAADEERLLAAHLGQCPTCRVRLASVAAGDRVASSWSDALRKPPTPVGPAMQEMLDSVGAGRTRSLSHDRSSPNDSRKASDSARLEPASPGVVGALLPSGADKSLPFLDPPDGPDCIGHLGRYRVLKLLGRGGMGVVFLARDPILDRLVAIKALSPQLCGSPAAHQRLLREARAAAAINHPNVVTIYSAEEVSGLLLLVMEYVDGASLQQQIENGGPLALAEIVRIGAEAAAGLAAAHACGVVHRDIKPANILLARPAGQVKITDFGLARAADDASLTRSGTVLGTPAFMAPEQARGGTVDHRADLFSLGSVLYAMSRAAPPYSGSTVAVIRAVADGRPARLKASGPELPQWLVDVVSKLHAIDPAERFQSAAEVAEILRQRVPRGGENLAAPAARSGKSDMPVPVVPPPARIGGGKGDSPTFADAVPGSAAKIGTVRIPPAHTAPEAGPAVELVPLPPPLASKEIHGPPRIVPYPQQPPRKRFRTPILLGLLCLALLAAVFGLAYKKRSSGDSPAAGGQLAAPPAVVSPQPPSDAAPQPFVLIRGNGGSRQAFAGLDAAVREARSGDVVEIRGGAPFQLPSLRLHDKALTLRSATGTRPVLRVPPVEAPSDAPAIQADSSLVLEGLDIQCIPANGKRVPPTILQVRRGPLLLVNCRLLHAGAGPAVRLEELAECEIRNCLLQAAACSSIDCFSSRKLHLTAINNIFSGFSAIAVHEAGADAAEAVLTLRRNTLVVREALRLHMDGGALSDAKNGAWRSVVRVESRRNYIDSSSALLTFQSDWTTPKEVERVKQYTRVENDGRLVPAVKKFLNSQVHAVVDGLKKIATMHNEQDAYCGSGTLLGLASSQDPGSIAGVAVPATVADWNQLWGMSPPGLVRIADGLLDGAAVRAKAAAEPRSLLAADFFRRFPGARRPDEASIEGAHTPFVGPGVPLENWKNTIDFRTWHQAHGQVAGE